MHRHRRLLRYALPYRRAFAMILVLTYTRVDFTWHTLIGCLATIIAGNLSSFVQWLPRKGVPG